MAETSPGSTLHMLRGPRSALAVRCPNPAVSRRMSQPRLLILDEPSIGLAPLVVNELFNVIQEINRNQVAILLIEQNTMSALNCAHRGYVLEHGHIVQSGPATLLLEDDSIRSSYLGL